MTGIAQVANEISKMPDQFLHFFWPDAHTLVAGTLEDRDVGIPMPMKNSAAFADRKQETAFQSDLFRDTQSRMNLFELLMFPTKLLLVLVEYRGLRIRLRA